MPLPLLDAYAVNLPRLAAEESLTAAERIAVGTGSLRKGEGRRIAHAWQRAADQRAPVIRPKGAAEYAAHMAAMGIGIRKVKPDG